MIHGLCNHRADVTNFSTTLFRRSTSGRLCVGVDDDFAVDKLSELLQLLLDVLLLRVKRQVPAPQYTSGNSQNPRLLSPFSITEHTDLINNVLPSSTSSLRGFVFFSERDVIRFWSSASMMNADGCSTYKEKCPYFEEIFLH